MSDEPLPLVAIGVGNVLLRDDAVGVRVVEALGEAAEHDPGAVPAGTRLVDGGTLGLDLLRVVQGSRGVVLVDAVRIGGPAGRVHVLRGDAIVRAGGTPDGQPGTAVGELVAVARLMRWLPEAAALVGIEVEDVGPGEGLSRAVDAAIPLAVATVGDELRRMDELPAWGTTGGDATRPMAGATA